MASAQLTTYEAILDAARSRLEEVGSAKLRMADVARAAGVSRQAIYLHFGSRSGLLVALVERIDAVEGLDALKQWVFQADTDADLLSRVVEMQAIYNPRIDSVAKALQSAAGSDPDAAAAWNNRMEARLAGCRAVVRRLMEHGSLNPALSEPTAAELLWSLLGIGPWRELVVERGWSSDRYTEQLRRLLHCTFLP